MLYTGIVLKKKNENVFIINNINTMDELILKLKQQIIEALNLEEITPEQIDTDAPLFVEGLGLDSIDALELVILLEREFGIRMEHPKANTEVFKSVRTLAQFIEKNRKA